MSRRKYVLGFMFSLDGQQVALIKKTKPKWQAGLLNGIGGKLEEVTPMPKFTRLEKPLEAMIREFREETGVDHREWTEIGLMHGENEGGWWVTVFSAKGDLSLLKTTTEEEVVIINRSDVGKSQVIINLNWLVPMAFCNEFNIEAVDFSLNYPNQP